MRLNRLTLSILFSGGLLQPLQLYATGFDASGTLSTSTQYQQIHSDTIGNDSILTLEVEPVVDLSYQSKKFDGFWRGSLRHLTRNTDKYASDNTFPEYDYSATLDAIENILSFTAEGALKYRNVNPYDFLISDIYTNSDNLSKARTNRYSSTLNIVNGNWVRGTGTISYSQVDAEESALRASNLRDNETYTAQGVLQNGDRARRLFWNVSGNYQQTERSQNNLGEFVSRFGTGYADMMVYGDWAVRVTSTHEANQQSSQDGSAGNTREFTSVGAGITYRQSAYRYISLTANTITAQSDSTGEETDEDDFFAGLDMRWAFTPRTSVSMQYGRRVFGESLSADVNYNTRHFRASLGYSENITNFARLLSDPQNLGLFVCPAGSASISDCFQPDSLNYQLGEGESLIPFVDQNITLEDSILLRKSAILQLGYQFSKTRLSLGLNYSDDDYLDFTGVRRTYGATLSANIAMNSRTNFVSSLRYANIEQEGENPQFSRQGSSDNWNLSVGLDRQLGRRLSGNVELGYIDKSGDLGSGRLGANYQDRRISVGLTYKFD